MKSFTNLYPQICSLENLYLAAGKARKRKTRQEDVERFELHRERHLRQLHEELVSESWQPSGYHRFTIHDPKTRTISAAPYRDRVVHHAVCNVLDPLISRRFVHDSYSCQKGKGTGAARERCRRYTNQYPYVLKCDIAKFFQSIDHQVLEAKLARIIRCRSTLCLCGKIIASACDDEIAPAMFPGDDARLTAHRIHGLPIGNLTSQLWANLYLDGMDHWLLENLRPAGYARYTDDFLIWGEAKAPLHGVRRDLADFLCADRLTLHPVKTRVLACRAGVPFLGFRFYPGRQPRLLGDVKRRFEKRIRRRVACYDGSDAARDDIAASYRGWIAFADYGNTGGLKLHYMTHGFGQAGQ